MRTLVILVIFAVCSGCLGTRGLGSSDPIRLDPTGVDGIAVTSIQPTSLGLKFTWVCRGSDVTVFRISRRRMAPDPEPDWEFVTDTSEFEWTAPRKPSGESWGYQIRSVK